MNFLQQKALYFGDEKVACDICPEDMSSEEIALMKSGFFEIMKDRDQGGRVILYHTFDRFPHECTIETTVRR